MIFERGEEQSPKGHAMIYWEYPGEARFLFTYIVVHPLEMSSLQLEEAGQIMKIAYPPNKLERLEQLKQDDRPQSHVHVFYAFHVDSLNRLRRVAEDRQDDVIKAGLLDSSTMLREEVLRVRDAYHKLVARRHSEEAEREKTQVLEEIEELLRRGEEFP